MERDSEKEKNSKRNVSEKEKGKEGKILSKNYERIILGLSRKKTAKNSTNKVPINKKV